MKLTPKELRIVEAAEQHAVKGRVELPSDALYVVTEQQDEWIVDIVRRDEPLPPGYMRSGGGRIEIKLSKPALSLIDLRRYQ